MVRKEWGQQLIPENFESYEEYLIYLQLKKFYEITALNIPKGCSILEAGCGDGFGAKILANDKHKVCAIDVNPEAIEEAKKKYWTKDCEFFVDDGCNLSFDDNTFDYVVSSHVIEHLKEDEKYVAEMFRVLKPDGVLIITTPNRKYRIGDNAQPWNPHHVTEYSQGQLRAVLKTSFTAVTMKGIRGREDVQKIEVDRVKKLRKIASLDVFNLRHKMPTWLRSRITAVIRKFFLHKEKEKVNTDLYNTDCFFETEYNLHESINLIGYCKK